MPIAHETPTAIPIPPPGRPLPRPSPDVSPHAAQTTAAAIRFPPPPPDTCTSNSARNNYKYHLSLPDRIPAPSGSSPNYWKGFHSSKHFARKLPIDVHFRSVDL